MSPSDDDARFLSGTRAEGSLELRRQHQHPVHGAPSSSQPPRRRARAAGTRCQGYYCCRRAKAGCAHRRCRGCCRRLGFVCPAHANRLPRVPASLSSQCSERQRMLHAALAADRKRPRALPSAATPTTSSSSVDQPMATAAAAGWFAREVSLDAVFRRVRLMGPPEAEVAYHTTVTIAGHVFRGVLYDGGPHSRSAEDASDTDDGSCDGSSRSTAARGSCLLDLTLRL